MLVAAFQQLLDQGEVGGVELVLLVGGSFVWGEVEFVLLEEGCHTSG